MTTNRLPPKERTIEKIKAGMVLERLLNHVNGKLDLTSTQCTVGIALLKKYIPDMKSIEHSGAIGGDRPIEKTEAELDREIAETSGQLAREKAAAKSKK